MKAATTALLVIAFAATRLDAQAPPTAPPNDVTAIGCVAQSPDSVTAPPTGHEQAAAKGLTLTRATMQTRDAIAGTRSSAVPGSQPAGSGTGTTDSASPRPAVRVEQSFWLVGAKAAELLRFLGRRVEVIGPLDERLAANPGGQTVTDAGASAARRSTSAPPEPSATAHPSAPTRAISVSSFRVLNDACS